MAISLTEMLHQIQSSDYKLQGRTSLLGLQIAIENKKGSFRKGVGADGKPWKVRMPFAYGYIMNTKGVDGQEVDCFIGPSERSSSVFVIHQGKEQNKKIYDEDKVMLGFLSKSSAVKAYKAAYTGVNLLMEVHKYPIADFKKLLQMKKGKKLQAQFDGGYYTQNVVDTPVSTESKGLSKKDKRSLENHKAGLDNAIRMGGPTPITTALAVQPSYL
jgi:hypothetical protein